MTAPWSASPCPLSCTGGADIDWLSVGWHCGAAASDIPVLKIISVLVSIKFF